MIPASQALGASATQQEDSHASATQRTVRFELVTMPARSDVPTQSKEGHQPRFSCQFTVNGGVREGIVHVVAVQTAEPGHTYVLGYMPVKGGVCDVRVILVDHSPKASYIEASLPA